MKILTMAVFTISMQAAVLDRMFDAKLTASQRNDACNELRGNRDPEVIDAMYRALALEPVRTCAGENLRAAQAIEPLKRALDDERPEVRALAARELGSFERGDLLPALAKAAADPNLLVATNAIQGLCQYRDGSSAAYLEPIAAQGGIVGIMALDRMEQIQGDTALRIARQLLKSADAADRVAAMRVVGEFGDGSDLPALRQIAASKEIASTRQRGFGLMPPIDLSRAATATIAQIQAHRSPNP